ncbi:MAG: hypothetical protein WCR54_04010 [Clostridia bacterium]
MRKPYMREDIYPSVSRYDYPIKKFAGVDAYSKEESLALNYAKYGYNIGIINGILTKGMGINVASSLQNSFPAFQDKNRVIKKMFFYKHFDYENNCQDDRLIVYVDDEYVYQAKMTDDGFNIINGSRIQGGDACFCNYNYQGKDCLLCEGSGEGEFIIYDGSVVTRISCDSVLSQLCIHKERVFGIEKGGNKLFFSATFNPTNWNVSLTEGGYLELADGSGFIKKIISYKDSLYIFKEYSIYKLNAYGEQSEFSLSKIFESNNFIYENSIVVCNNNIIFMADDGFYLFDGYSCTKILQGIFPLIEDKNYIESCYFNHKYYLSCKIKTDDEVIGDETDTVIKNNAILSIDLANNDIEIFRGCDIKGFVPVSINSINKLFVYFNSTDRKYQIGQIDQSGKLFDTPLAKKWESVVTDFELLDKDKVLRRIYIKTACDVTLITHIDGDYSYNIVGVNGASALVVINKRAEQIGLTITSDDENFVVRGILLEFDLIRRLANE